METPVYFKPFKIFSRNDVVQLNVLVIKLGKMSSKNEIGLQHQVL